MRDHYEHVCAYALEHPWALTPSMLQIVAGILARRYAGEGPDAEAIGAALVARSNRVSAPHGQPLAGHAIAKIPLYGVVAPRMNLLSDTSGGTTFETLTSQLRAAVADPRVTHIVLDVDSPGGNAAGATEFAKEVLQARSKKRITASVNHMAASAAYWAVSGATEIVASPSAMVGGIGVYSIYDDISEALAKLGIKREIYSAGKFKAEGVGGTGLTPEAKAHINAVVNSAYGRFVRSVADGRGVSSLEVRTGLGEGRVLDAESALQARLVDRIATLDEVLSGPDVTAQASLLRRQQELQAAMVAHRQHELDALVRRRLQ